MLNVLFQIAQEIMLLLINQHSYTCTFWDTLYTVGRRPSFTFNMNILNTIINMHVMQLTRCIIFSVLQSEETFFEVFNLLANEKTKSYILAPSARCSTELPTITIGLCASDNT